MPSLVDDRLVQAIARKESNNDPEAIGDEHLGGNRAIGAFQMRPIAFKDLQRIYPEEYGAIRFEHLRADPALQARAGRRYLDALHEEYQFTDLDHVIAAYNAGPTAIRKALREGRPIPNPGYVDDVKRILQSLPPGKGPMPQPPIPRPQSMLPAGPSFDPTEERIRRMNQTAVAMGLLPLKVEELATLLTTYTPRQPIRGRGQPQPGPSVPPMPSGLQGGLA